TLERREPINRGHPENPMAPEEVSEKFRANASRALPPEQVEDVVARILSLEKLAHVSELTRLLAPQAAPARR
ncbi:MAG: hypothetical protein ACE5JJ_10935, partial [Nitrospinota bacterium]